MLKRHIANSAKMNSIKKKLILLVSGVSVFIFSIQINHYLIGGLTISGRSTPRQQKTSTSTQNELRGRSNSSIIMIHYHKTRHDLTRKIRSHVLNQTSLLEAFPNIKRENCQRRATPSGYVERDFGPMTKCPAPLDLGGCFLTVVESPELYCNTNEMIKVLLGEEIDSLPIQQNVSQTNDKDSLKNDDGAKETRIIHFIRNPYSMALSNYLYHSQVPPPEKWTKFHNPCKLKYKSPNDKFTLKDLVFPTLSFSSDNFILTSDEFDKVTQLCNSLYRVDPSMKKEYFESHLQKLDPFDGLRLSTAQLIIRGVGRGIGAGGELLRMANNIIRLRDMQSLLSASRFGSINHTFSLATVSMDDFINHPFNFTMKYEKIMIGGNGLPVDENELRKMAYAMESKYEEKKSTGSNHVTSKSKNQQKKELTVLLKKDPVIGPILDRVETLVERALLETNRIWEG